MQPKQRIWLETLIYRFGKIIINFRHSKRLKFGSNVLKFGIRNKDVVIIVYNDYQQN